MAKAKITLNILSYWHAGTGMGEGANLDAVVIKKVNDLPFLPGKTLKGLFKEAVLSAFECGLLKDRTTLNLFGGPVTNRFDSEMGSLEFSDATLGEAMEKWAMQEANKFKCRQLFRRVSSTAIDDKGQAESKTLRSIEVVIPLTLTSTVESDMQDKKWADDLAKAAPFIRYLGTHRHRGLGRVKITVS